MNHEFGWFIAMVDSTCVNEKLLRIHVLIGIPISVYFALNRKQFLLYPEINSIGHPER